MNSIRSRIILSFIMVITLIMLILGALFIGMIRQYYYGSARQALHERATVTESFYDQYLAYRSLQEKSRYILENNAIDDFIRIEIVDPARYLVMDSYGFTPNKLISTPDIIQALAGEASTWSGKDPETGENILAVSRPLREDGHTIGVIRYTTSLEQTDAAVRKITISAVGIGLAIILLSLSVSLLVSKTIIRPIRELTGVAHQMAGGNFHVKAQKRNEDEVGHLAETLNVMSDQIVKTEKLKNDFISSISHDLRTPLTSIKGWSETLVSTDPHNREETILGLGVIAKETDRLIGLVEDLLDFSKLQSSGLKLELEPVPLRRLLEEVCLQFAASAHHQSVGFKVNLSHEYIVISGDPNRLKQLFVNLLDNAFKYTPKGGVVTLSLYKSADGKRAAVDTSDTGEGIPANDLPHVTRKFYKGATPHPGSGLGLSICQELAALHRGTLNIASELGRGTTVTVTFPLITD